MERFISIINETNSVSILSRVDKAHSLPNVYIMISCLRTLPSMAAPDTQRKAIKPVGRYEFGIFTTNVMIISGLRKLIYKYFSYA